MSFLVVLRKLRHYWLGIPARPGKRRDTAARAARARRARRVQVEPLEDRTLLSTYFVDATNGADTMQNGSQQHPFATLQQAMALANGPTHVGYDGQATGIGASDTVLVYGNGAANATGVLNSVPYVWTNVVGGTTNPDPNITVSGNPNGNDPTFTTPTKPATNVPAGIFDTLIFRAKALDRTGADPNDGPAAPIVVKMEQNIIDVAGELRVEGDPTAPVVFTSFLDPTAGTANGTTPPANSPVANRRDWGGIRYRGTSVDMGPDETTGSLVDYADIRFSGATLPDPVLPLDSTGVHQKTEFASIRMEYDGPDRTLFGTGFNENNVSKVRVENTIFRWGGRALDVDLWSLAGTTQIADPTIFATTHKNTAITGPDIRNVSFDVLSTPPTPRISPTAQGNSINGLLVDIPFVPTTVDFKGLTSEWDDVGVPYVLTQRLNITTDENTGIKSTLTIDAGMVIKDESNEIWAAGDDVSHGGTLNVNGTAAKPVFFTGLRDDTVENDPRIAALYSNGSQDTDNDEIFGSVPVGPSPGEWGGITIADGNIDHAVILFGGGTVRRPPNLFEHGGPLRGGGPFPDNTGKNGPFFQGVGGPLYNTAPLTISNGFNSVYLPGTPGHTDGYGAVRVSNTEISGGAAGTIGAAGQALGAIMAVGSGQIDILDNWIHDNPNLAAIYTWGQGTYNTTGNQPDNPSVYNTRPDPLGGYGMRVQGNLVSGNGNNGIVTNSINDVTAYIDNTDIVQTVQNQINVTDTNQVIELLSQRAAQPVINLDTFTGDTSALTAFLKEVPGLIPAGGTSGLLANNGDNDFFTRFIDFESTARGQALLGAGQEDTGNLTGEEWRDYGVEFVNPSDTTDYMPLKVESPQQEKSLYSSGTLALPIPDAPLPPLLSTINVTNNFAVNHVTVEVNITHPRDADLRLELIHTDTVTGKTFTVRLVNQAGGVGSNFNNTTFSDQALQTINAGAAPFFGTFVPEQPLSSFNGMNAQGNWTLRVTDLASGQVGTLNSWSLRFQGNGLVGNGDPDPFSPVSGNNILSTATPFQNSSIEMVFPEQVSAVGFWVVGADVVNANDKVDFFAADGSLVREVPMQPTLASQFFVGVVSKTPIYRVVISKDPTELLPGTNIPDTIGIDDLFFVSAGQNLVVKEQTTATTPGSGVVAGGSDFNGGATVRSPGLPGTVPTIFVSAGMNPMGTAGDGPGVPRTPHYAGEDVAANGKIALGGTLRILGTGTNPVVLTSLKDDSAAAGELPRRPGLPSFYVPDTLSAVQGDTNGDGSATAPTPGDWTGIQLQAGVNSSQSLNVTQQTNGTIIETSNSSDPYVIGSPGADPAGSTTNPVVVNPNSVAAADGIVASQQSLQDGTLIQHALINYAVTGIESSAYPNGSQSLEGTETDNNNGTNNSPATADPLSPMIVNQDGNVVFDTYNGATRVEGRNTGGNNPDFWSLPTSAPINPQDLYIDVSKVTATDAPGSGPVDIWVFNAFNQLVYANGPNLHPGSGTFGSGAQSGMSGYLAGTEGDPTRTPPASDSTFTSPGASPGFTQVHMLGGDTGPYHVSASPGPIRDATYIVVTSVGNSPDALFLPNIIAFYTPLSVDPVTGLVEGYGVSFTDTSGNFVDIPQDSNFDFGGIGFVSPTNPFGGYELEVRTPELLADPAAPGGFVDIHQGDEGAAVPTGAHFAEAGAAIRVIEGQIILDGNTIQNSQTAGINLHDNLVNNPNADNASLPPAPSQAARYFLPNADINTNTNQILTNPQDLIPGLQVFNNVIRLNPTGIQIADSTTGNFAGGAVSGRLSASSPQVASGYHLILNNTIDANTGDGIDITSRGGAYVLNNLSTNNGGAGINVTDTGDVLTQGNIRIEPFVAPAQAVVDFSITFNDAGGDILGSFQSLNLKNLVADPQYLDEKNGNYRIAETSPAVDSAESDLFDRLDTARGGTVASGLIGGVPGSVPDPAIPAAAPNTDFAGRTRHDDPQRSNTGVGTQPFYDRGAFEAPLTVLAVPDFYGAPPAPPVLSNQVLSVPAPGVLANDLGADPNVGEKLVVTGGSTVSALGAPVVLNEDGSFTYDPTKSPAIQALAPGQSTTDTFTYQVTNADGQTQSTTVTITVTAPAATGGGGGGTGPTAPPGVVSPAQITFLPGRVKKLKNGLFRMVVQAFNLGNQAIPQPLVLLVGNLGAAQLVNASGTSTRVAPGTKFLIQFLPNQVLNSFEGASFTLLFRAKSAKKIRPGFMLVAGEFPV
jgi:VCBS repeat-containing protein